MTDIEAEPLNGVLEAAADSAEAGRVEVGELLDSIGRRGFGPILIVLGLFAVSPIAAIPGVAPAIGLIIVLIAGQLLLGLKHPWVPARLKALGFERARIDKLRETAGPWLRRIDKIVSRRLTWAAGPVAVRLTAAICIVLAGLMVPLELIPFAVAMPGSAVIVYGIALTARDGVAMLLGLALTAATVVAAIGWI